MRKQLRFRNVEELKRDRTIKLDNPSPGDLFPKVARQQVIKSARDWQARRIISHRRRHLISEEQAQGYIRNRTFQTMLENDEIDLKQILLHRLNPNGQTRVLHSGSGHLALDESIKKAFGKKVFITSLNVIHPNPIEPPQKIAQREIELANKEFKQGKFPVMDLQRKKEKAITKIGIRNETAQRAKIVDEIRVSSAERFRTKKTYHLILDIFGPLFYSYRPHEVMQSYLEALKENGEILTTKSVVQDSRLDREYTDARTRKKYSLKITPLNKGQTIWSITKVQIK